MMKPLLFASFLLASIASVAQIPDRVIKEWEILTSDGGTWIADNSLYKNENEPADAYGITWTYSLGKTSVNGRLFGLKDGKETGTYWEFRMYYHPAEKKLMYQQFGWGGALGTAEMKLLDETHSEDVATIYNPDGSSTQIKHESEIKNDIQYSQSYQWMDNAWQKQRYYEWKKKI